jgi:DNA modification methylase
VNHQILPGDNITSLKQLIDTGTQLDSCVVDPPYGISFCGSTWDYDVPSVELWSLVLQVLKPGAHVLSFGSPRTYHRMVVNMEDAGFEIRDQLAWIYGTGFPHSKNCLKPAMEPIVLARKPIEENTVADNVTQHGTGSINIDSCRIGTSKNVPASISTRKTSNIYGTFQGETGNESGHDPNIGRWPANLLLDETAAEMLDEQSGQSSYARHKTKRSGTKEIDGAQYHGGFAGQDDVTVGYGDAGGASRFFYVPKASKAERNGSGHPTIKPVTLLRYLCRLITPPAGTIIDPFAGTGSTGEAAELEGFNSILMEREPEYVEDITRRLAVYQPVESDAK